MRTRALAASLLATVLLTAPLVGSPAPARAQTADEENSPGELAKEGMERLLRALNLFIEMIPQYESPEVLENGDIIIRRKRKPDDSENPDEAEPEVEKTGA